MSVLEEISTPEPPSSLLACSSCLQTLLSVDDS